MQKGHLRFQCNICEVNNGCLQRVNKPIHGIYQHLVDCRTANTGASSGGGDEENGQGREDGDARGEEDEVEAAAQRVVAHVVGDDLRAQLQQVRGGVADDEHCKACARHLHWGRQF